MSLLATVAPVASDAADAAPPAAGLVVRAAKRTAPRPPASTVRADMLVRYQQGPDERRLVELRPWGDRRQLMAHSRGPRDFDQESRLLPMAHDPKRPPVTQALRALAALYFGPIGLMPRILGEADWHEASLALQTEDEAGHDMLLQVQLRVEGRNGLRAQVRHAMPDAAQTGPATLVMRPGDADPLHALLRVGFGTTPWPLPA